MTRLPSTETKSASKRKGTRSVSTLTPSQLARKRANDREAQRAIRTRTKEHIDRLEREVDELRNRYSRDETVQDLMRRNRALEEELMGLRDSLGIRPGRPMPTAHYEDPMSPSASGMSSRASSFGQSSAEYGAVPGFGTPYIPAPDPRESWASILPCPVPSVVSSPASSLGGGDDYMGGYIPTSVPSSMIDRGVVPQSLSGLEGVKPEFDDLESDSGYSQHGVPRTPTSTLMSQSQWPLYGMIYPNSPAL